MEVALVLIGLIFSVMGVIFIYDARKLTKKLFSFQDINEGTKAVKIFGLVITLIGLAIVFVCFNSAMEMLKSM